jgi:hypothetical protein
MKRTMNMTSQFSLRAGIALSLSVLVGLPLGASTAGATPVSIDLCAVAGTMPLPGEPTAVPIWGYVDCSDDPHSPPPLLRPGGPDLEYSQGAAVSIILHNKLAGVSTGLVFPSVPKPPDTIGVATGGMKTYSFTVSKPGTFLYQAAPLPKAQYQVAMGLYGAMTVSPSGSKAYGDLQSTQDSTFDEQKTLVLSEIDPALNRAVPGAFNMRNFAPRYGLINGAVHPNTSAIPAAAGDQVLLRYVNAGLKLHSMAALGVRQRVIAYDANELRYSHTVVAETFGPGQTADVIASVPTSATAGTKYAIYDASLSLHNSAAGTGGMLTFITVGTSSTPPATPTTTGVTLTNALDGSVVVTATFAPPASLGAEYFIDAVGADGSGSAIAVPISAADIAALSNGTHLVYVHGQNDAGWGPVSSAPLSIDKAGPSTSGLVLNPAVSSGTGSVVLTATGNDAATGGANVTGGNYTVAGPGGSTGALVPNGPVATTTALKATIAAGSLTEGTHIVSVTSTDEHGNVGPIASITLAVDRSGPTGTPGAPPATPNPTNGKVGVSSGVAAVRIRATFTDALSSIAGAEAFIDPATPLALPNGTGIVFTPTDGVWGPKLAGLNTDAVFADVPLSTITGLLDGHRKVYVHAKDSTGNWGPAISFDLVVDKTAPTLTGITLSPASVSGGATASTILTVNGASDGSGTGVASGEYWFGNTDIGVGTGTSFNGASVTIPMGTLAPGTYTIRARIRDTLNNWSVVRTAPLVVTYANAIFSNAFNSGTNPWGWSSASTGTATRLNRTAAAGLPAGTTGLQAQGNNTNYVQWNFPTGTAVSTYDAKFSFRPNGNASTGSDIFVARTSNNGNVVFRVRYRMNAGTPQVQIQVGTGNGNLTWTNINGGTAVNTIQVVWQSGSTLVLYVNGTVASQLLTATNNSIGSIRLGSVSSGGSAVLMHFDAFASKRLATPLL